MPFPQAWISLTILVCSALPTTLATAQLGWSWRSSWTAPPTASEDAGRGGSAAEGPARDAKSEEAATSRPETGAAETLPTDAERITRLRRSLEADQEVIQGLRASLENPGSEYRQAEVEFQRLDEALDAARAADATSADASHRADDTTGTAADKSDSGSLAELGKRWELAKQRFDVAIEQRKTVQEKILTLERKVQQDQQALSKLQGAIEPNPSSPPPNAANPPSPESPPVSPAKNPAPPASVPPVGAPQSADTLVPSSLVSPPGGSSQINPVPGFAPNKIPTPATLSFPAPPLSPPVQAEVRKATEMAQEKEAEASEAEAEVESIGERIELLRRDINLERKLLETSRKKSDLAEDAYRVAEADFRRQWAEGGTKEQVDRAQRELQQTQNRVRQARGESRDLATRLDKLQSQLAELQAEQIVILQHAEGKRLAANTAKRRVERLQNPLAPRNVALWFLNHGTKVGVILIVMFGLLWVSRMVGKRLVTIMSPVELSARPDEWENQARTLFGVFLNAAKVAILGGGGLMILDAIGVPVTALMGGAAVLGLAVAFGAQSLIKDYFYGFMILFEQQYTVNDVIRIGEISGQVERITLRTTVLRDLEGRVHFIPHGQITSTTNMTQGWSRAVFEIGIAYREDTDRVMEVIREVGKELRRDREFGPLTLDELTMLGVNAFGESALMLKFFIKTLPLRQWQVKREMLRRLKRRFDELGIEIPFPHRTVYQRSVAQPPVASSDLSVVAWSEHEAA